ncbi:MAG: hypothetical protein K2I87_01200 [Bacteroidales bacterium]|nr:hypothetical protein [Bacteroidales bacterium]
MAKTAKTKTAFFCSNCGAQSPKWVGRCPACGEWNTYTEEVIERNPQPQPWNKDRSLLPTQGKSKPALIRDIESQCPIAHRHGQPRAQPRIGRRPGSRFIRAYRG